MQHSPDHPIAAVAIGASAGGIDALLQILRGLPPGFSLPIVVVLHLPEDRNSRLVEVFRAHVALPVVEALDKCRIEPGTLYFACAGYHLSIEQDLSFSLSCEAPLHYSRPSVDILMESAADAYGERLLGIVLSGANHDGAAGLAHIKRMGGLTVVQNPEQAQAAAMPRAAIDLTQPDLVLPLQEIHSLLLTVEKH
jgi:two-component system chemotaxis response regulator CheB